jgi:tetratricopeptide (TPR) repeat protein
VNTAARLEQHAQPGETLLGEATHRLVRDAVIADPVTPIEAKGKSELLRAHRLLQVVAGAEAVTRRLDSPLVGRDHELQILHQAFDRAMSARACHLVTLLGPAGVGKSRLVLEFLGAVGTDATVLRGRCLPYGEGITYWPLAEMVRSAAQIREDDSPQQALSRLQALLRGDEQAEVVAQRVAQVVGLVKDSASPEETFWAVRLLFESVAGDRPLVAVVDDVHWAEPTFLDLLEHLADWTRGAPLLLVCVARPELLDRRPTWGGGKMNAASILLEPLPDDATETLITNLLGGGGLDKDASARIAAAAEGNPLFVEEMVSMLIDDGLLGREDGRWVQQGDLTRIGIPPSVQALIAARLDRLAPDERAAIERASVEGKVFHLGAVSALSGDGPASDVRAQLMSLVRKELVRPERAELPGQEAFRFRHLLVRDAAYESLPKESRAELHERFASWLERTVGERVREFEEILGYHLEQAYRNRAELGPLDASGVELGRRAARHLAAAGRRAQARGDVIAAGNLFGRAASVLGADDPDRIRLLPDLGEALTNQGEFDAGAQVLDEAIERARGLGDLGSEISATALRLNVKLSLEPEGTTGEIRRELDRMIPALEGMEDDRAVVRVWSLAGDLHWMAMRFEEAERSSTPILDYIRRSGDMSPLGLAIGRITSGFLLGPTPAGEGVQRCDELLNEFADHPLIEAFVQMAAAPMRVMLGGDPDAARGHIRRAGALMQDMGMELLGGGVEAERLFFVGQAIGDLSGCEEPIRAAIEAFQRAGEQGYLSTQAVYLAETVYASRDLDEAERWLAVAEGAGASDDMATVTQLRSIRAKLLAHRGEHDDATREARSALELLARTDSLNILADAHVDLATVHRLAGRSDEEAAALQEALSLYERKENRVAATRTRDALRGL